MDKGIRLKFSDHKVINNYEEPRIRVHTCIPDTAADEDVFKVLNIKIRARDSDTRKSQLISGLGWV